jgi:hypothetical protein
MPIDPIVIELAVTELKRTPGFYRVRVVGKYIVWFERKALVKKTRDPLGDAARELLKGKHLGVLCSNLRPAPGERFGGLFRRDVWRTDRIVIRGGEAEPVLVGDAAATT